MFVLIQEKRDEVDNVKTKCGQEPFLMVPLNVDDSTNRMFIVGNVIRVCDADKLQLKRWNAALVECLLLNEPQLSLAVCTAARIISFSLSQDGFSVQRAAKSHSSWCC